MNILFLLPEYFPHQGGGIATFYDQLLPSLSLVTNKIKVIVGSGYVQSDETFVNNGIEVEYLSPIIYDKYLKKFNRFETIPMFRRNIAAAWAMWEQSNKGEGFDLIECTDFGLGFIPWLINHNRPVNIRLHGSTGQINFYDPRPKENLYGDLCRQTELLFFNLADELQTYSENNKLFWEEQLGKEVIKLFPIYQSKVKFNNSSKKDYGLVTGRIQYWKGPTVLCEAIKLLQTEIPLIKWFGNDMPYNISGQTMQSFLAKTYPKIWKHKIIPQSSVDLNTINEVQSNARFGIIPSIWDMFNFTCIEFMASGTLVICSDGAGANELIESDINGFKFHTNDARELASILDSINNITEARYKDLTNRAKETIQILSPVNQTPLYLDRYLSIKTAFKHKKTSQFIKATYSPDSQKNSLDDILSELPLKKLVKYVLKKGLKKILP